MLIGLFIFVMTVNPIGSKVVLIVMKVYRSLINKQRWFILFFLVINFIFFINFAIASELINKDVGDKELFNKDNPERTIVKTIEHEKFYDNYQVVETDNIDFHMMKKANHYWRNDGLDFYEVIVYNMNIKGYTNKTLRITWYDDRYVDDRIRINYTIKNGILNKKDIVPYSVNKDSKLTFTNLNIEILDNYSENVKVIEHFNEKNGELTRNNVYEKDYSWKDYEVIDLGNPLLNYKAIDDVEIGGCGTLDAENETYTLNQSVSSSGTCFTITAKNVTLDCDNYNITFSTDGTDNEYGIVTDQNYTKVLNCNVYDGNQTTENNNRYGVYFNGANFGNISNTISNVTNRRSIYLYSSSNNTLTNNTGTSGTEDGIYLHSSSNNTLTNNIGTSGTYGGIRLDSSCNYNTLTNNTGTSGTYGGIYLYSSCNYNTLTNNIVTSGTYGGIRLYSSSNNTLTNNTGTSGTYGGIYLHSSSNYNTLTNNTGTSGTEGGIYLHSSSNNTLTNNTGTSGTYGGIRLYSSSNNTLTNNIGTSGTEGGIHLHSSSNYNTLTNNTGTSGTYGGIRLSSSSNYNTLTNNTGTSGTYGGIHLDSSSNYNTITDSIANSLDDDRHLYVLNSSYNTFDTITADFYFIENAEIQIDNYFYGLTNALLYNVNGSIIGSSTIQNNDGNINITLPPNNDNYILDKFNLTEGVERENSPLSMTRNLYTYTVTNTLEEEITVTVVTSDIYVCSGVAFVKVNGEIVDYTCNSPLTFDAPLPSGTSTITIGYEEPYCQDLITGLSTATSLFGLIFLVFVIGFLVTMLTTGATVDIQSVVATLIVSAVIALAGMLIIAEMLGC